MDVMLCTNVAASFHHLRVFTSTAYFMLVNYLLSDIDFWPPFFHRKLFWCTATYQNLHEYPFANGSYFFFHLNHINAINIQIYPFKSTVHTFQLQFFSITFHVDYQLCVRFASTFRGKCSFYGVFIRDCWFKMQLY